MFFNAKNCVCITCFTLCENFAKLLTRAYTERHFVFVNAALDQHIGGSAAEFMCVCSCSVSPPEFRPTGLLFAGGLAVFSA